MEDKCAGGLLLPYVAEELAEKPLLVSSCFYSDEAIVCKIHSQDSLSNLLETARVGHGEKSVGNDSRGSPAVRYIQYYGSVQLLYGSKVKFKVKTLNIC